LGSDYDRSYRERSEGRYGSGGGRERGSERYGRGGGEYGRGSQYGRGRSSSWGRGGEYQSGGREGYWGGGWENERDERSRYGNPIGGSGFERGYNDTSSGYSSQRSNYPGGYGSSERYGERGSEYDRERYGGGGEERGWWDRASDAVASWFGDEDAERRRRMDEQRAHRRGRGPKGYRRSDERIREDVNDRLGDDYYIDASDIEVTVSNTEVTLTGTVPSRNDKRRAEDIAESVSGVTNVENRLRVKQSTPSYLGTGMTGTGLETHTDTSSGSSMGSSTGSSMGSSTGTSSSSSAGTGLESGTPGTTTSSAAAGGGSTGTRGGRSTGD
jgi:osmotically-inducible protein OsmY